MSRTSAAAPRATYGIASTILKYIDRHPRKTMSEIVKALGISRMEFNVTIECLEDPNFVRGGYYKRTDGYYFYVYRIVGEGPIENKLKYLRETLPD